MNKILTVLTNWKRKDYLEDILKSFQNQTISTDIVVVDNGSEYENLKLSELRNKGNKVCKGDITVCMDDDDYYPNDRVSHAVEKLSSSKAKIAGCSGVLIYDYFLEKQTNQTLHQVCSYYCGSLGSYKSAICFDKL